MELNVKEIRKKHLNDIKTKLEYTKMTKRVAAEKVSFIPDDYIMDMEELIDIIEEQNQEIEDYKSGYFFTAKQMHFIDEDYIAKDKIIGKIEELEEKAEKVKEHYRGTYACLDEYLNAKSKIQGYKELLEE